MVLWFIIAKILVNNVIDCFEAANNSNFAPAIEKKQFGIIFGPYIKKKY